MPDRPPRAARRLFLGVALGALFAAPASAEVTRPRPPRRVRRAGAGQRPAAPSGGTHPGRGAS